MSRRWWQVAFAIVAITVAALTVVTVPAQQLGPWSAGVLGPLVAIGAAVCVLSWPPRFDDDDLRENRRTPWRGLYLIPLLVAGVAAPVLLRRPPAGLNPVFTLGLVVFLAYLALLLGVVVFLVILLPIGQLLRAAGAVIQGHRVSGYGPSAAALILTVTIFSFAGSFAIDGISDDEFGLLTLVAAVAGAHLPGLTVVSSGWLLVARVAGIGMLASAVGIYLAGKRLGRPDPPA